MSLRPAKKFSGQSQAKKQTKTKPKTTPPKWPNKQKAKQQQQQVMVHIKENDCSVLSQVVLWLSLMSVLNMQIQTDFDYNFSGKMKVQ